ncbi:hypothetical protein BS50DRAFT_550911 [Corynespora cassiicola Philippines]|uniref:Nuclear protein DGCR14 n=1 Tax=Corynespora cassiicola Philippines TaxID=1448308 RepID=A0A2T2NRX1_CORCC|nr:hypothetical protein BS50DRAFT_550911 [Corynespora cassiicola Philippines]
MPSQNSTALTKRSASDALMPPPAAPKRIKRPAIVLDEDTYTSAIDHIIRRDFFPGLAETDAQREYLNALESKNKTWIREAGNKLSQIMTPVPRGQRRRHVGGGGAVEKTPIGRVGQTPSAWGGDTPVSISVSETEPSEEGNKPKVDLNLSLQAFQAKYTSEDQESFSQIIDKANAKKFEQNAWLRDGNRFASKQRIAQQKVIEASNTGEASSSKEVMLRPSQDLDHRPAAPDMHKHTAFNTLMFNPDSVESWAPTRAQTAESASLAPPKQVNYNNTRLPLLEEEPPRPPSPTMSAVRDAIAGRPRLTPSEGGFGGSDAPLVKGYAFIAPSNRTDPDSDSDSDDAPTDLLEKFGAKGSSATPFIIHDSNSREKLHHKMVDTINAKRSGNVGGSNNSSHSGAGLGKGLGIFKGETPRFSSAPTPARLQAAGRTPGRKNVGNLTPAAQRLFERVGGGTPKNVGSGGFGNSSLGNEWTPTPRPRRKM